MEDKNKINNANNEVMQAVDILNYVMSNVGELPIIDQLAIVSSVVEYSKTLLPFYLKLTKDDDTKSYIIKL